MILKEAWHDPSVSQKRVVGALNRPTRNAMLHVRCAIAVELLITLDLINRTALLPSPPDRHASEQTLRDARHAKGEASIAAFGSLIKLISTPVCRRRFSPIRAQNTTV